MAESVQLNYRLPHVIESLQEGWLETCKTSATISALMALISAYLLVFVKNTQFQGSTPAGSLPFLTLVSYGGLVFNISATVSAFLLTDRLGSMAIKSSKRRDLARDGTVDAPSSFLLKKYGAGSGWTWSMWHWFFCVLAGLWCIIIQILVYVFLQESKTIQIGITCVVAFATLPFLQLLPSPNAYEKTASSA